MATILIIDTSMEEAQLALAKEGHSIDMLSNNQQKDHAAWIHTAIQKLLNNQDITLQQVDAMAITNGPGSYTGLRVGMATAKGICYALNKPLITVNTLQAMALAAKDGGSHWLCPMIDARRLEVFTAVYSQSLEEVMEPRALILDQFSYQPIMEKNPILFFGSGSAKFKTICSHPNAHFRDIKFEISSLAPFMEEKFQQADFSDLAYSEPAYLKEFFGGRA